MGDVKTLLGTAIGAGVAIYAIDKLACPHCGRKHKRGHCSKAKKYF